MLLDAVADLVIVADLAKETMARGKQFVYDGLASGTLTPVIARTFVLDGIVDAHRYMASNRQMGEIVVVV